MEDVIDPPSASDHSPVGVDDDKEVYYASQDEEDLVLEILDISVLNDDEEFEAYQLENEVSAADDNAEESALVVSFNLRCLAPGAIEYYCNITDEEWLEEKRLHISGDDGDETGRSMRIGRSVYTNTKMIDESRVANAVNEEITEENEWGEASNAEENTLTDVSTSEEDDVGSEGDGLVDTAGLIAEFRLVDEDTSEEEWDWQPRGNTGDDVEE